MMSPRPRPRPAGHVVPQPGAPPRRVRSRRRKVRGSIGGCAAATGPMTASSWAPLRTGGPCCWWSGWSSGVHGWSPTTRRRTGSAGRLAQRHRPSQDGLRGGHRGGAVRRVDRLHHPTDGRRSAPGSVHPVAAGIGLVRAEQGPGGPVGGGGPALPAGKAVIERAKADGSWAALDPPPARGTRRPRHRPAVGAGRGGGVGDVPVVRAQADPVLDHHGQAAGDPSPAHRGGRGRGSGGAAGRPAARRTPGG